jgi:hypothetical protein
MAACSGVGTLPGLRDILEPLTNAYFEKSFDFPARSLSIL